MTNKNISINLCKLEVNLANTQQKTENPKKTCKIFEKTYKKIQKQIKTLTKQFFVDPMLKFYFFCKAFGRGVRDTFRVWVDLLLIIVLTLLTCVDSIFLVLYLKYIRVKCGVIHCSDSIGLGFHSLTLVSKLFIISQIWAPSTPDYELRSHFGYKGANYCPMVTCGWKMSVGENPPIILVCTDNKKDEQHRTPFQSSITTTLLRRTHAIFR